MIFEYACLFVFVSVLPAVVTQEIEMRAGGGLCVPMGEMCRMLLMRQDWFGTMFPRLPVNVLKVIEDKLKNIRRQKRCGQLYTVCCV